MAGCTAPAPRQHPGVVGAARAVVAEMGEAPGDVGVIAAKPALGEERGELSRSALVLSAMDHVSEARMQRKPRQRPALLSDAAVCIQCFELAQQSDGLGPCRRGWRV